jgi:hypothetical protein
MPIGIKKVAVSISTDRDYLAGRARGEGGMAAGHLINARPSEQFLKKRLILDFAPRPTSLLP